MPETKISDVQPDERLTLGLLEAKIRQVRALRVEIEVHETEYNAKHAEFNQANALLIEKWQKSKADLADAEARLRELTLEAYAATGSKKPAQGVGIRVVKAITYDVDKALHWAVANGFLNCLQLNKKNFDKVAEGLRPDFAEIREVPQATIAKEL